MPAFPANRSKIRTIAGRRRREQAKTLNVPAVCNGLPLPGLRDRTPERQEQVPQGVDRLSAPEAGAEDGVQALALRGDGVLVGSRARKRGEDREQQQVPHAVALALGTARVGHFGECGKQGSEWHVATSRNWTAASMQPLPQPAAVHAQATTAELNGSVVQQTVEQTKTAEII